MEMIDENGFIIAPHQRVTQIPVDEDRKIDWGAITTRITRAQRVNEMEQSTFDNMYSGFRITCIACGSTKVAVKNGMDYHPDDGTWGEVKLKCENCEYSITIAECL